MEPFAVWQDDRPFWRRYARLTRAWIEVRVEVRIDSPDHQAPCVSPVRCNLRSREEGLVELFRSLSDGLNDSAVPRARSTEIGSCARYQVRCADELHGRRRDRHSPESAFQLIDISTQRGEPGEGHNAGPDGLDRSS